MWLNQFYKILGSLVMIYRIPRFIKLLIKQKYNQFRAIVRKLIGYPVIYNANKVNEEDFNKRALLIYLVKPFLINDNDSRFLKHTNFKRCLFISKILDEFGYVVDVVDINDMRFKPSKDYDLIISHRVNLNGMENLFKKEAIKIYLSTGMNHVVHNKNIRRRYESLYKRRNCRVKIRQLHTENMPYVLSAYAIICLGNKFIMNTWKEIFKIPTYSFNNYGFKTTKFLVEDKDFSIARKNFLFFASGTQVGKGLDLLLEIFPKIPDFNLYICSSFENERDFCNCYHKELYETPNIHPIGWVGVNSDKFYELVQKCAYVILPTCSDASTGSVVQCIYAGLIPIVTKEAGIDTEDFGITLMDDTLDKIEKTIIELSELPADWHREHSLRTREMAENKYSEKAFINRWREIVSEILEINWNTHD